MEYALEKNTAIPELKALMASREVGTIVRFRNQDGELALAKGLKNEDGVAVCDSRVPNGMRFDEHTHNAETEWIIVYQGTLIYREGHIEKTLRPGDAVGIQAGIAHSVEAIGGDAMVIAITIPPSEVFPHGP